MNHKPQLIEPYASTPLRRRLRWVRERKLHGRTWITTYTAVVPGASRVQIQGLVPARLKVVFGVPRALPGRGKRVWSVVIQTEATDGPWARFDRVRDAQAGKRWMRRNLVDMGLVATPWPAAYVRILREGAAWLLGDGADTPPLPAEYRALDPVLALRRAWDGCRDAGVLLDFVREHDMIAYKVAVDAWHAFVTPRLPLREDCTAEMCDVIRTAVACPIPPEPPRR